MGQAFRQQMAGAVVALRLIAWFLVGVVASAILVVVVPPVDVILLLAVATATVAIRVRDRRFGQRSTAMLAGATAFSIYTLVWAWS